MEKTIDYQKIFSEELKGLPEEVLPNLLEIIRLFKNSVLQNHKDNLQEEFARQNKQTDEEKREVYFDKFVYRDKEYLLKEPVKCKVSYEDGYWSYENEDYTLSVCEKNRNEALLALNEQFAYLCDIYLDKNNNELTVNARKLRDLLKENLKEIRKIDA
jgi:hypothetical protein